MEVPPGSDALQPGEEPARSSRGLQLVATLVGGAVIIGGVILLAGVIDSPPPPTPPTTTSTTTTTLPPEPESLAPLWQAAEYLELAYDIVAADRQQLADAASAGLAAAADMGAPASSPGPVPNGVPEGFEAAWANWLHIHRELAGFDSRDLMVGAIEAMVATTGDPDAAVLLDVPVEQDGYVEDAFFGIGAFVNAVDDFVVISQPFPGSPASQAGLRPGDVLVGVDGQSVVGMPLDEVVALVRGPAGTTVNLLIERAGSDPVTVEVVRESLALGTARSLLHPEGIGYLKVSSFESRTPAEVERELEALLIREIRALIVDLRGTSGGRPSAGVAVADHFLDGDPVYFEEDLDGIRTGHNAQPGGLVTDIPLAVLIDPGTSGVAELVATALRIHERGPLIGLPSGGQSTIHKGRDLGEGIVMVARSGVWLAPNERVVPADGLAPDFLVGLTEEDIGAGFDRPQQTANAYLWSLVEGQFEELFEPEDEDG